MTDKKSEAPSARTLAARALADESTNKHDNLLQAADELRQKMERRSLEIRDLILAQPPVQLLGYVLAQLHMSILAELKEKDEDYRPNKKLIEEFQFTLEYLHAVWSCHTALIEEATPLDEAKAKALLELFHELKTTTMMYCMVSSAANVSPEGSRGSSETEFHAKSSWVLIRGHRYQVLEEEFFKFVLAPHAEALRAAYGMDVDKIAAGIQALANSMRSGVSDAILTLRNRMDQTKALKSNPDEDLGAVIQRLEEMDSTFTREVSGAIRDIFFGGICSLSRHTTFTPALLEDLSYEPGGNTEFFADGPFKGTPMRTLPAMVRPGIRLGDEYYVTDGQFARDAAYRAIQRGLLARAPQYREEWNRRQKKLIEQSYPSILSTQLATAAKYSDIYFKDPPTGQWAETDLVLTMEDVLLVIEAKAGVMAMHSPATNFDRHERVIRELIIKAYEQCKRFVEYLASASEAPIYSLVDGKYVEVAKLRRERFRAILPIGLTVEAFTPFSAMSKEIAEIQPLLGQHPFVSMSVDDLFVLNRFLPTTGELLHYLEVRQQVAGLPRALLFDEIEHLGAYIRDNRFDMTIRDQFKKADMVTWDSFGDVVDKHFEGDTWKTAPVPGQRYPEELVGILAALDKHRPSGWLAIDAFLRNLSGDGRDNLARTIAELKPSLHKHPARRFQFGTENPLQLWLCRAGAGPSLQEIQFNAEAGCLAVNATQMMVLRVSYNAKDQITGVSCFIFGRPSIIQTNYDELKREAERQRGRIVKLGAPKKRSEKKRL